MIIPIILSGGVGTRLWPVSRREYPKQFLPLLNEHSMLQNTVERIMGIENIQAPIVVCHENNRFIAAEQLRQIDVSPNSIILESVINNTAPAIALAAFHVAQKNEDAIVLVAPADHVIKNRENFHTAVATAYECIKQGGDDRLVTFGITPDYPETGYGYIKTGTQINDNCFKVSSFVEKPNQEKAEEYLKHGSYYWNSGMFMFRAKTYLSQLEKFSPKIYSATKQAILHAKSDDIFLRPDSKVMQQCPVDSIDYAVMERTTSAYMTKLDVIWSDIGSWQALNEQFPHDENGNLTIGDVVLHNVTNSYIRSENHLVAAIGVSDLAIIDTEDALLVMPKNCSQDVKHVVKALKAENREEAIVHKKIYRPWGFYHSIIAKPGFQVKCLIVNPGAQLSLQLHHYRAEHWVVVEGVATVTRGDKTFLLHKNQSTFIPLETKHRICNETDKRLVIVEVQTGEYLAEDDIVRFEDDYGRDV